MLVKLEGREVRLTSGVAVAVWDDELPMRFADRPRVPELLQTNGKKVKTLNRCDGEWVWWPTGTPEKNAADRRYGLFRIDAQGQQFTIDLQPRRVVSRGEYRTMLAELSQWLPSALFEQKELGIRVPSSVVASAPAADLDALLRDVVAEADIASRIVRRPFSDLAPMRPGQRGNSLAHTDRTTELPENAVVVGWARARSLALQRWAVEFEHAADRLDAEVVEAGGSAAPWVDELAIEVAKLRKASADARRVRARVQRIAREAGRIAGACSWAPVPAVRRRPGPSHLARATRREANQPGLATAVALSPRPVSFVYETWAAWKIAQLLEVLGFLPARRPDARDIRRLADDLVLPFQARWEFVRGGTTLSWFHGVRALPGTPAKSPRTWSLVESIGLQRSAQGARNVFVGKGETLTPDYALVARCDGRTVWVAGDAKFSDPRFPQGILSKMEDVRNKYARGLAWLDAVGRPVLAAPAGSFVVVPAPMHRFADAESIAEGESRHDVSVLSIAPGAYDLAKLEAIVETLVLRLQSA